MKMPLALIVEDHLASAEFFATALGESGFETEIIRDGQNALERLSEIVPDMVILDLNLPGVHGSEILKAVRGDERLADTHVIVTTTHWQGADEVEQEADLVILKPVGFEQLRDLASRFLPRESET